MDAAVSGQPDPVTSPDGAASPSAAAATSRDEARAAEIESSRFAARDAETAQAQPAGVGRRRLAVTWRAAAAWIDRNLFPVAEQPARWWVPVLGLPVAFAIALFRIPVRTALDTLWAEDGRVFLTQQYSRGLSYAFFQPYAGYMHAVPRLIAWVASSATPLTDAAVVVNVLGVAVHAALAVFVYEATRAHIASAFVRLIAPAFIAAVPIGPEVLNGVANLQWVLLPAAFFALLWTPRRTIGLVVGCVVVLAATMSSPFGILLVPLALLRIGARSRWPSGWFVGGATLLGTALQLGIMAHTTRRTLDAVHPVQLARGFVERVVGDGTLGTYLQARVEQSLLVGVLVLIVIATLSAIGIRLRGSAGIATLVLTLAMAALFFAVPNTLSGRVIFRPLLAPRYYTPALVLIGFAISLACEPWLRARRLRAGQWRWLPVSVVAAALFATVVVGTVTSWHVINDYGRQHGPWWRPAVREARASCTGRAAGTAVEIPITPVLRPPTWYVRVTCGHVTS